MSRNDVIIGRTRISVKAFLAGLGFLILIGLCLYIAVILTSIARQGQPLVNLVPTVAPDPIQLSEIQNCCTQMTEVQRKAYLATLIGKRVAWQGTVNDAQSNGTIWVDIDSHRIEMNGAPASVTGSLNRGQFIRFIATITKAEQTFLQPGVQLRFESLR